MLFSVISMSDKNDSLENLLEPLIYYKFDFYFINK